MTPYTIAPCRYDSPERDHIERCKPEEAEFWSLYNLDRPEGGCDE